MRYCQLCFNCVEIISRPMKSATIKYNPHSPMMVHFTFTNHHICRTGFLVYGVRRRSPGSSFGGRSSGITKVDDDPDYDVTTQKKRIKETILNRLQDKQPDRRSEHITFIVFCLCMFPANKASYYLCVLGISTIAGSEPKGATTE